MQRLQTANRLFDDLIYLMSLIQQTLNLKQMCKFGLQDKGRLLSIEAHVCFFLITLIVIIIILYYCCCRSERK